MKVKNAAEFYKKYWRNDQLGNGERVAVVTMTKKGRQFFLGKIRVTPSVRLPHRVNTLVTPVGTASKLTSFPDYFLPNCFRFLVLYTVYCSGLAVLYLSHSK